MAGRINERSEDYGSLQSLIDALYERRKTITQIDLLIHAEAVDLNPDLIEICTLVPPGAYVRHRLCDQINSSISAHGWGFKYGTVE